MGKMNENALHANEGYAAILIAGVIKIFWGLPNAGRRYAIKDRS